MTSSAKPYRQGTRGKISLPDLVVDYLSGLTITQGRHAGKPFEVLPWQRRFIKGTFRPGIGEAALSLGRGGGKSTLIAGLGCAALATDGPLMQPNSEVLVVASSHQQGRLDLQARLEVHRRRHRP